MDESFVSKIREFAVAQPGSIPFPPASQSDIEEAERRLGFSIPPLLKSIYLEIGNGGFGPGRGGRIIGLKGGYESDLGTLVEGYEQVKAGQEFAGDQWQAGLLPFFEWGSNIFSCVDCNDSAYPIYQSEECEVTLKGYDLRSFFQMWMDGVEILDFEGTPSETVEIINPFTGKKASVSRRKKK